MTSPLRQQQIKKNIGVFQSPSTVKLHKRAQEFSGEGSRTTKTGNMTTNHGNSRIRQNLF